MTSRRRLRPGQIDELFDALCSRVHRLSSDDYGAIWSEATLLAELGDGASHLIPRFVDAIERAQGERNGEAEASVESLAVELFATTLGRILGNAEADMRFANEVPRLSDAMLVRVLAKRHPHNARPSAARGAQALNEALLARVEHASPGLLLLTLTLLGRADDHLHPAFAGLAMRALRQLKLKPGAPDAEALVFAAVEPYRMEHWDASNTRYVHPAPEEFVALGLDALESVEEGDGQRCVVEMLVAQGRAALVAEYAARTGQMEPLMMLAQDAAYTALASTTLQEMAADRSRALSKRWEATSVLRDPRTRCDLLLQLGLDGFEAAATQLGYLHASTGEQALKALRVLSKKAPTKTLQKNASEIVKRIQRQNAGREP